MACCRVAHRLLALQPEFATKALDTMHPNALLVSGQIPLQPLRGVSLPRALMGRADLWMPEANVLSDPRRRLNSKQPDALSRWQIG
jgi:hypothetical protein